MENEEKTVEKFLQSQNTVLYGMFDIVQLAMATIDQEADAYYRLEKLQDEIKQAHIYNNIALAAINRTIDLPLTKTVPKPILPPPNNIQ